jgi:porin
MPKRLLPSLTAVAFAATLLAAHADTPNPLSVAGHFDVDAMANLAGGTGAHSESSALLQWGGSYDTGAANWWNGGLFEFSLEGVRSGGSGDAGSGAVQIPSNEWAPDFLRVYQATYRHDFGGADLRAGIMDVNQYFESSDQASLLHNSSFGMLPNVMANTDGPSFPNPGLGAMGEARLGSAWQARAGLWQGDPPALGGAFAHGGFGIAELERDWSAGDALASDVKLGLWHDTNPFLGALASGGYLIGETRWKQGGQSWGAFVLAGTSPEQANLVHGFAAAGLLLGAPFAARAQDQASVGISRVTLATGAPETVAEAVYSWQLTPVVALQPDVQRFWNPGGSGAAAWIAGARLHVGF